MKRRYTNPIEAINEAGHPEKISDDEIVAKTKKWYIPHHAVLNPNKPSKILIVYDSDTNANGGSLNDFLMKGPGLTN